MSPLAPRPRASHAVKRTLRSLLFISVVLVPLAGQWQRMADPRIILLLTLLYLLDRIQPELPIDQGQQSDRKSATVLLSAGLVCQILPIIEWAQATDSYDANVQHWLGAGVLVTGAVLRAWAILTLGRFFSAQVELQPNHSLVRRGPYRLLRHPSYTGAVLFLVGVPIMLGTPWSIAICCTLLGAAYAYRIPVEEKVLAEHFGQDFLLYKRTTKRLIPFVW